MLGVIRYLTGLIAVDRIPHTTSIAFHIGRYLGTIGVIHRVTEVRRQVQLLIGTRHILVLELEEVNGFLRCMDTHHIAVLRARHRLDDIARVGRVNELIDIAVLTFHR